MNPSDMIDKEIKDLADWRGKAIAEIRKLIHDADSEIIEEWKWMGTATWSHNGIICVANAHKEMVKVTFAKGASIPDPEKLFNAGLEGNVRRAINIFEGDKVKVRAFKNLVLASVALNSSKTQNKINSKQK